MNEDEEQPKVFQAMVQNPPKLQPAMVVVGIVIAPTETHQHGDKIIHAGQPILLSDTAQANRLIQTGRAEYVETQEEIIHEPE